MHKKSIIAAILTGVIVISGVNVYAAKGKASPPPDKPQSTSEHMRPDPAEIRKKINSALDELVTSKVITEDQKTAIIQDMEEKRKAAMERKDNKDDNGNKDTKGQKESKDNKGKELKDGKGSYKEGNCGHNNKNLFLHDLVEKGTITQKQADAVREAIKSALGFDKKK